MRKKRAISPRIALIPVLAGVFFAADDQTIIVTVLPQIMVDLNVEITELHNAAWTITGYLLGYVCAIPIMGNLSDIYGRRNVYVYAMVIFMVGSVASALSNSVEWLLFSRIIQSIGAGALIPVAIALIGDLYPPDKRGLPLGVAGGVAEAGAMIGPLLGGVITQFFDWRWIFWMNIPIGIFIIIALYIYTPSSKRRDVKVDYIGFGLITGILCFLTLACTKVATPGFSMILYFSIAATFAIAYIGFASRISYRPIIPNVLFKSVNFCASNCAHFIYGASLIIAMVTIPLMANTILRGSPMDGGLMLARMTIAIPIGAILGGILCRFRDHRIPLLLSLAISSLCLYSMSTWTDNIPEPQMTLQLFTCGIGFGLLIAPVNLSALNSFAPDYRGIASGIITSSRIIGMTLGIAALSAWGGNKFGDLIAGIPLPIPTAGDTASQIMEKTASFESNITGVGISLFNDFFTAAAVLCLITVIPCLFVTNKNSSSSTDPHLH